jgi:hypothetical protein
MPRRTAGKNQNETLWSIWHSLPALRLELCVQFRVGSAKMRNFSLKIHHLHLQFLDLLVCLVEAGLFRARQQRNTGYCQKL